MVCECEKHTGKCSRIFPIPVGVGAPKLPPVFNDKPPVMSSPTASKILMDNLTVPLKAREAYVASQSSEKIPSTLIHNARTSGNIKYTTDDSVY